MPAALVLNVLNVAFNVSKLARIVVKWAELPTTHQLTRDLLLSSMQTALNYSVQAKLLSSLKAASYPVVEIESSTYTALRGLSLAIATLYDACCFLDFSAMDAAASATDADPNAVAQSTALCLHFGFPTPVERKLEIEEEFADNPDINVRYVDLMLLSPLNLISFSLELRKLPETSSMRSMRWTSISTARREAALERRSMPTTCSTQSTTSSVIRVCNRWGFFS